MIFYGKEQRNVYEYVVPQRYDHPFPCIPCMV